MNKIIKNIIIKPIVFILVLLTLLVTAGLIYDMTREGTHFTRSITDSKDAKLIKSNYWGFVDLTIRHHFIATPEVIDSIIKDKGLKPVNNEELIVYSLPKNEEWLLPPGEISSYVYKVYVESKSLEGGLLSSVDALQHNQQKTEAFYISDDH
jgi:hypothetical protein